MEVWKDFRDLKEEVVKWNKGFQLRNGWKETPEGRLVNLLIYDTPHTCLVKDFDKSWYQVLVVYRTPMHNLM